MTELVRVEELTKRHGDRVVLESVSLHVDRGEVVAVVGPSGSGKTTLLRCIEGLESFDSGTIRVADAALVAGGAAVSANVVALRSIRQRLGYVFQQLHLFPHRTSIGNVIEAPVHVRGSSVADATREARALLEKVGMTHRENAYPSELSGGEQQRVAIARALAMAPEALLLDEPTSALDPERIEDLARLLSSLAREGLAMLVVTHDVRFTERLAHRVVTLSRGRVGSN